MLRAIGIGACWLVYTRLPGRNTESRHYAAAIYPREYVTLYYKITLLARPWEVDGAITLFHRILLP